MRKKTIFIILLALLGIALVIIVLRNIPTKTEALFPAPDKIVCFYNGEEYVLTGEQSRQLFELFAKFEPKGDNILSKSLEGELRDHADAPTPEFYTDTLALEFRYSFPKKYTGGFGTKHPTEEDTVTFDKIVMLYKGGELLFDYYNNRRRCDLYGDENMHSMLSSISMIGFPAFLRRMEQCVVDNLMDTTLWQVESTDPAVSDMFPAMPDSVLLHIDGRTAKLKGKDLEKMHSALVLACSGGTISHSQSGPARFGYAIGTAEQSVLVELRYNRRQKFVPDPIPDEQKYGVAVYRAYANKEYDSLIFAWGGEGDELSHTTGGCEDMHIFLNLDGSYDWWRKNNSHIGVPPETEAALSDIRRHVRV